MSSPSPEGGKKIAYVPPKLSGLPPELLVLIFSYPSQSDIKSVRQVCRAFDDCAREHLAVDRVYVSYHKKNLERLTAISRHEYFRKKVRILVYDCSELTEREIELKNSNNYLEIAIFYSQPQVFDPACLTETAAVLADALPRLPAVNTIVVSKSTVGTKDQTGVSPSMRAATTSGVFRPTIYRSELRASDSLNQALTVLRSALVKTPNTKIQRFIVAYSARPQNHTAGPYFTSLEMVQPEHMQATVGIFRWLTHLSITVNVSADRQYTVRPLLDQLMGLEVLHLHSCARYTYPEYRFQLENCVGNITWPKLREFGVFGIASSWRRYVDFLRRHAASLRVVLLDRPVISGIAWLDVLDDLNKSELQLEDVRGDDFWENARLMLPSARSSEDETWLRREGPERRIRLAETGRPGLREGEVCTHIITPDALREFFLYNGSNPLSLPHETILYQR